MLRLLKENQIKLGVYEKNEKDHDDPGIYTVPVFPNQPIHPESEITKRVQENRELEESKVCVENIERINDELTNPEQGIPCPYTLTEIAEMDILSLNRLFSIPEFLVVRNIKREQNELLQFNTSFSVDVFSNQDMKQEGGDNEEHEEQRAYPDDPKVEETQEDNSHLNGDDKASKHDEKVESKDGNDKTQAPEIIVS